MIDNTGFNESAQFQQMVPVATISREPRRIEAQHGTHLARAQRRDQAIKAGPRHGSARGSSEIIIDDLNVGKTVVTGNIYEVILPPLALEIGHDLGLCGLPHIDDGLALQQLRRNQISTGHRRAPRRRGRRPASGFEQA